MNARTQSVQDISHRNGILILAISTLLITQFLFFIDEGYYDLRWMKDIGNWIVFAAYNFLIFTGQVVFFEVLLRKMKGVDKIVYSILGGTVSVLVGVFVVF